MNAIIIEDEKLSAEHLTNLLKKIDSNINIIATFDTVKKSVEEFKKGIKADLLFVDIHLADGLSFDLFAQIVIDTPVIFTTAYDEYAIKAFKINSVDYLLKPIGIEDLRTAIYKYNKLNTQHQSLIIENITNAYNTINKQYKNRFMVKMGNSIASIKAEDIVHFISEDGIVLLVNNVGKRYPIDYTLDQLETLIAPELFFRINRKVIININAIQKVSSYFNSRLIITADNLSNDDNIISRDRVNEFKLWLDK